MKDILVILLLLLIIGGAVLYILREKKRGAKCIGCPYAKQCGGKCGSCGHLSAEKQH